jgi:hypothetical protein
VAKKKGTRKGAARATRKASTSRRSGTRKAASRQSEGASRRVNLKPLQRILATEIRRLEGYAPSPKVEETLKLLGETKTMLTNACATAKLPMVIEF